MVRIFLYLEVLTYTMYTCKAVPPIDGKSGFSHCFSCVRVYVALYTVSFTNGRGARKPSFVRVHLYFKNVHDQQLTEAM